MDLARPLWRKTEILYFSNQIVLAIVLRWEDDTNELSLRFSEKGLHISTPNLASTNFCSVDIVNINSATHQNELFSHRNHHEKASKRQWHLLRPTPYSPSTNSIEVDVSINPSMTFGTSLTGTPR